MSIIGGPLPGQEKEDQWGNTNLIESWQHKTIGKEVVDKATEFAIRSASKIPEKQQEQLIKAGSFVGEKYQDARTLEGKEWLDPSAVVTAGAVRTIEGIGWLGEKTLAKPIEFVGHNVLGLDPRAAAAVGIAGEIILTAGGAPKVAKGAKYLKSGQALDDLTQAAFKYADPDSVAGLVYQTGGGVAPVPTKLQQASLVDRLFPGTTKSKKLLRERINSPAGDEYRALIAKHDKILENVKPSMVDRAEVRISPLSEAELIKDARRLITLKEELGIPNPKVYQRELGAFIKDDHVARITGGQKSSDKIGQFQSTKPFYDRWQRENIWDVKNDPWEGLFEDKMNPRRVEARTKSKELIKDRRTIEADHINILETTTPWAVIKDSSGKYVWRSREQLDDITKIMKEKYNIDLGNVNENWMMASVEAHRTGDLAKHRTLGSVTDFQKPLVYADADQIQVTLNNGATKWLDQRNGNLFDGDTLIKPGQIKKKGNLKLKGSEYSPTQKHGASLKLQDTLASIEDTEELADAMKLFMIDSGANEVMAGATTLASYAYDKAEHLDPLTLKLREENIPAMINYMDTLLDTPQYANNKLLKDLKRRFTNRMEQNLMDYKRQLQQRGS